MFEQKVVAYVAAVTEVEFGWGARPDGYVFAPTKEALEAARAKCIERKSSYGYDIVESTVTFEPNAKGIEAMKNSKNDGNTVWINNNLSEYGKKL